ncbi:hypothetical protein KC330_g47 [Hortaea werneckii]|nr:hypothetical protein KC330_g47 [Hortaea werneckii]
MNGRSRGAFRSYEAWCLVRGVGRRRKTALVKAALLVSLSFLSNTALAHPALVPGMAWLCGVPMSRCSVTLTSNQQQQQQQRS